MQSNPITHEDIGRARKMFPTETKGKTAWAIINMILGDEQYGGDGENYPYSSQLPGFTH